MARGGWGVLTGAAMGCTMIAGALFPRESAAVTAPDFWPLVKCAGRGVWGTLLEIQVDADDRLLVIAAAEQAIPEVARGASIVRLLEHHGQLPEGTPLRPGDSGLFLYREGTSTPSEFIAVDGEFVPAGLLRLSLASPERSAVAALLGADASKSPRAAAFELLAAPQATCRTLAVAWLAEHSGTVTELEQDRLALAFANELETSVQNSLLELFLLAGLDLADGGAARLLLRDDSPELLETSIRYLQRFSTVRDRALLLQAFPGAAPERRALLLEAYARMPLPEAWLWWEETLRVGDPDTLLTAVDLAAVGGYSASLPWYDALLESSSPHLRKAGLEGLATLRSAESIQRLRRFRLESDPEDPLTGFADKLLKYPYRYAKPPRN
ncbi:MAG: hypothetical protein AB7O52_01705 [Planctomycetota bacterium]